MNKIQDFKFKFEILKKDKKSKARVGKITTAHGIIETPAFVAVGTQATVKGLSPKDLQETGVQVLFGNTYHLHLRPGEDLVKDFGGLAKFMSWNGPTITDSGGFQVFSLGQRKIKILQGDEEANLVKITEDGVEFRSHIDGSKHFFTPEISIEIQKKLGADIILAFDECAPQPSDHDYTKEAMERTHKWALRSLAAFKSEIRSTKSETNSNVQNPNNKTVSNFDIRYSNFYHNWQQALYGIIQGGVYRDLREESAKFISALPFDGIAIGGVAVGESKKEMREAVDWSYPFLPEDKPRHLLGIGEIDDIFDVIERGMDTFDCVIPTRFGRYGIVFVDPPVGNLKNRFRIDLNKVVFAKDAGPISKTCSCYVCTNFTKGYIHHLVRAQELLAYRLASYHNMFFINNLVKKIRESILEDKFQELKRNWLG
ncbi:MAG: Queuine tRNA-ribosyltransferase [Candidatus Levybacteria bacterium GW2011_GWB1_37_8]|nr:MAG: Queuine tRNA-ribosyltransferase [Candidatus Levybacteria bacterium GW2011_GWC2_37_7]KKQ42884.1 MAG: Queuine tRNA-ribosyltransferase [Candidatus Levybacteria bacterium GW2011_GWB1_37_8]